MKCKNCGFESNNNGDLFCNYCGSRLVDEKKEEPIYDKPVEPKSDVNNGGSSGKNNSVIITAIIAAVICVVAICVTVGVIATGKKPASEEKTTAAVEVTDESQEDYESEENDDEAATTKQKQTEKATQNKKISAGTRCKVDSYIDGYNSLIVRKSASKSAGEVCSAGRDNYVTVIEDYDSGDYIKISILTEGDLYEGWVLVEYLHIVDDEEGMEDYGLTPGTRCRVTYSDGLNLWVKPHSDLERRKRDGSNGKVPCDDTVEIVETYNINDNGYVYASYGNLMGWVDAEYLEIVSDDYVYTPPETESYEENYFTVSDARRIFKNAQSVFEEYFCLDENELDFDDSVIHYSPVTNQNETYYRTKNFDSADEIRNILKEYISSDGCDYIIDSYYTQYEGKLYHHYFTAGWETGYEVQSDDHFAVGDKIKYILDVDYVTYGERGDSPDRVYYFLKEDGKWVIQYMNEDDIAVKFN